MSKTVGALSSELKQKADQPINPQEIQQAQEKEYLDNLIWAVEHARKKVECADEDCKKNCATRDAMDGDFFIVGLLKKEKLLDNVLRNYFIPTKTCPTPSHDQTVYQFIAEKEDIKFLWVVPDQETSMILYDNRNIVVPEERGLLQFVIDYYEGNLYRLAKKLNGESMHIGAALKEGN